MTISWFSMAMSRIPNSSNEYWITFYFTHSGEKFKVKKSGKNTY